MKVIIILTILAINIFALACAENNSSSKNLANSQNTEKQIYKSVGVVKNIDTESGKITIDHENIPGYMSAMEMNELVRDKSMLETVKVGDNVEFEIERTGSKIVITKIKKIGEDAMVKVFSIYKTNCAECHGEKGEGVEGKGIPLTSGHALHHSEAEHIKQVTNGEGKKMPAFKDKLSTEEIAEVVKFVREEIQKNKKREDSNKHQH